MKNNKINYLVVGSFVLVMLLGFVFVVALLTGRTGETEPYYAIYDNVTDLKFGTQVLYEGYPIGQVETITPIVREGRMRFKLELSVLSGWRIPADSVAQVASSGLLSPVTISIYAGESDVPLESGDTITSGESANIFAAMSSVAGQITDLTEHGIKPLLTNLNKSVSGFSEIVESDVSELLGQMKTLVSTLNVDAPEISGSLSGFAQHLEAGGEHLRRLLEVPKPVQVENTLRNFEQMAANFSELSAKLNHSREQLDALLKSSNRMVTGNEKEVQRSLENVAYVIDSVTRHVDDINHNLDRTARNMNEFSRKIKENPGLLLGGSAPRDEAVQ